jgi:hypothetical protein
MEDKKMIEINIYFFVSISVNYNKDHQGILKPLNSSSSVLLNQAFHETDKTVSIGL